MREVGKAGQVYRNETDHLPLHNTPTSHVGKVPEDEQEVGILNEFFR